ncbi:alpha/beta hydrolase [Gordonia aichiensis]|uniref:Alpha/beta hydrolase fold-5 domain-containing protein n=1 Tax=Gordonia aichiensis NBRC 108223 TaxID=1220583 RepID=L7KG77_9ACTN|nr:alpha/beta fold hydrolase [Gordonia aichiensis]GAC47471.1 hypothetical protein GOACH_03_04920 [Gordonia aichiensis NBRC 108223]
MTPRLNVLVLPGGTDNSYRPFSPTQGTALRMYPFTWSIKARFGGDVDVRQVRYQVYGWNGGQASPMPYAHAALDAITQDHPDIPVVLIGHSMGGRVAAHLGSDERVVGILALAPWWQHRDWRRIHAGVRVCAIHGDADTLTSPRRTAEGIAELRDEGYDATFVSVPGGRHAMLDHIGLWQKSAIEFVHHAMHDVV